MIFLADIIFLLAIFMITRSLELQTLDILMIGLVVLIDAAGVSTLGQADGEPKYGY